MQQFNLEDRGDLDNYMSVVDTYTATIYCGTEGKNGVSYEPGGKYNDKYWLGHKICQDYCNLLGLCVTIEQVRYVYTDGNEYGLKIGLINYPRFPSNKQTLQIHAITLAKRLKKKLKQKRVTVVFPDKTYMIGHPSNTP